MSYETALFSVDSIVSVREEYRANSLLKGNVVGKITESFQLGTVVHYRVRFNNVSLTLTHGVLESVKN
jgi:hypothetical protein